MNLLFAIVLLLLAKSSRAQVTLLNTIEHIQYRIVAVNDFGEFYALKNKTNLIKLSANGDSMNLFKGFYSGEITNVDATNPLNVLVEYGFVNKAIVMDRLLIPKWEIDFQKLDLGNNVASAMSSDGNIWLYNPLSATLLKYNKNLENVIEGIDLRLLMDNIPSHVSLVEIERKLFLSDPEIGVFIFDQYGSLLKQIPMKFSKFLGTRNHFIFYLKEKQIMKQDILSNQDEVFLDLSKLNKPNVLMTTNNILIQDEKNLSIYSFN